MNRIAESQNNSVAHFEFRCGDGRVPVRVCRLCQLRLSDINALDVFGGRLRRLSVMCKSW